MSEEQDRESRTEEPTEKRITDALEKGNVPFSREAVTFGSLVALYLCLKLLAGWSARTLTAGLAFELGQAGSIDLADRADAVNLLTHIGKLAATAVLPLLGLLAALPVVGAVAQNLPQIAADRIAPKFSRISPSAGFNRLFSFPALVEFLKALVKIGLVATIAFVILRQQMATIMDAMTMDPWTIPGVLADLAMAMLVSLAALSLVLAMADIAWSRIKWRRSLRMTRQEVKEEHKQQEGDPLVKLRIRNIARQRVSRRMMDRLPQATLVVANPTHYAVALRYVRDEGGAPLVLAKGVDHLALRIRQTAEEIVIPVVENKPLARALYDTAEIDSEIPQDLYKSVAEIIHFLQVRKLYTAPAVTGQNQPRTSLRT